MEISLLMQLPIAAIAAILLYTFIGFIPGTDETSVLVPVTLALVLAGVSPIVVLTFFIAAIVTLNLTNAIPTALVGLPGGVLSTPMMEHSLYLKEKGRAAETIKKMAAGSGIGTLVSIPVSLAIATAITPYAETLREYGSLLFVDNVKLSDSKVRHSQMSKSDDATLIDNVSHALLERVPK